MQVNTMLRNIGAAGWTLSKAATSSIIIPYKLRQVNRQVATAPVDDADIKKLSNDDLKALIEAEWTRAKEIDEKLQKLTAALSVAVTVGGLVGTTMLQDLAASGWKLAAAILFVAAVVLLVAGVAIGFNGLRPKPRYGYGAGFMVVMATGGPAAATELVEAASSFQRDNQIRANEATAATISIRNGIFFFVLAVLVGLAAAAFGKIPQASKPASSLALNCFI